jgi:hypothetical protein
MTVRRLVSALRDVFNLPSDGAAMHPADRIPPVPLPADAPDGWRLFESTYGPYRRFAVRYPRDWSAMAPGEDPAHLQPPARSGLDLAVTLSASAVPVMGPQGILDAIEELAEARGVDLRPSDVHLDRWGDDGWAGSWAWQEHRGSDVRAWRLLVVGHDQERVYCLINGAQADVKKARDTWSRILASLRLPSADVLPPEHFPGALCELLNDRRATGEPEWAFDQTGVLMSGPLRVRLGSLYRAYLIQEDLEEVAAALDLQSRQEVDETWAGRSWEDVSDNLRVVLRRRDAVGHMEVVQIPVSDELVACPVLDHEDHMAFIPRAETARWGVDPLDLLTQAVARLDADPGVRLQPVRDADDGTLIGYRIGAGDGYDSGRLLCPKLRTKLESKLGGDLIVALPAAGYILVLRDDDESRIGLRQEAEVSYQRRPRPLSQQVWRWTEAGLEVVPG